MKVFSISDLHLSFDEKKPMDIFGAGWENHFEKIKADWLSKVESGDIVLICGDISWGNKLEEGVADLCALKDLPGRKIFIRGNHDFWWNGISKLRASAPDDTFYFLQNDCVKLDGLVIFGSRGWTCPGSSDFTETDLKLYLREVERFKLCLNQVNKVKAEGDRLLAMVHFPPFSPKIPDTELTKLFEETGVEKVIFGHIHGDTYFPLHTQKNGVEYIMTSCDKVGFKLQRIL